MDESMDDKIRILQALIMKEKNNTALVMMLEVIAEISGKLETAEQEVVRLRETIGRTMKGGGATPPRSFIG